MAGYTAQDQRAYVCVVDPYHEQLPEKKQLLEQTVSYVMPGVCCNTKLLYFLIRVQPRTMSLHDLQRY